MNNIEYLKEIISKICLEYNLPYEIIQDKYLNITTSNTIFEKIKLNKINYYLDNKYNIIYNNKLKKVGEKKDNNIIIY